MEEKVKNIKLMALFVIAVLVINACVSEPKFADVLGREWLLFEIRTGADTIL